MNVKESDNFDEEPSETLINMLMEIERHDCDVYLMLISNGIQMKSLLRFGDK